MKRIILLSIMFIFLIGNINAQDSTKVELTKETIYKDVKNALSQLGDALKVGAEHVYGILVKQQVAESITWSVVLILPMIFLLIYGKSVWKWAVENDHDSDGFSIFCAIVFFILTILPSIISIFYINTIVTGFVNPEYGAIKEIMELIK